MVVGSGKLTDPLPYQEAVMGTDKEPWRKKMGDELDLISEKGVWSVPITDGNQRTRDEVGIRSSSKETAPSVDTRDDWLQKRFKQRNDVDYREVYVTLRCINFLNLYCRRQYSTNGECFSWMYVRHL